MLDGALECERIRFRIGFRFRLVAEKGDFQLLAAEAGRVFGIATRDEQGGRKEGRKYDNVLFIFFRLFKRVFGNEVMVSTHIVELRLRVDVVYFAVGCSDGHIEPELTFG